MEGNLPDLAIKPGIMLMRHVYVVKIICNHRWLGMSVPQLFITAIDITSAFFDVEYNRS